MPSLHDLQARFAGAITDPDAPIPPHVIGRSGEVPVKRFAVYRNNVIVSLIEALEAGFPATVKLVGDEFFRAVARVFVVEHPPQSPILLKFGDRFAEFLDIFPPARQVPFLADVARLEWAWQVAYNAADLKPANIEAFADIDPERMADITVDFHPATHIVASRFPVVSLWRANTEDETAAIDMDKAETALVTRPGLDVEIRILPEGAGAFLTALQTGATLGEAAAVAGDQTQAFDLAANIAGMFETGAVAEISLAGGDHA